MVVVIYCCRNKQSADVGPKRAARVQGNLENMKLLAAPTLYLPCTGMYIGQNLMSATTSKRRSSQGAKAAAPSGSFRNTKEASNFFLAHKTTKLTSVSACFREKRRAQKSPNKTPTISLWSLIER